MPSASDAARGLPPEPVVAEAKASRARIAYRADIDGLRALAIALVVAFHFGVPGATGGYIGVDLFFVISGFLIASIFESGSVTSPAGFALFYARRVKRLLPAFVVVALATIIVATFLLLPEDYQEFLRSVRDSLLFRANLYFDQVTTNYFAANAAELPWLHTWSLSVEWQFYFAFPLLFVAVRRAPGRWRLLAIAGIAAIGVALSIAMTNDDARHAYFSGVARFFEFALGAVAVFVARPKPGAPASRAVAVVGILALVAMAFAFDVDSPFPGLRGLAVCALGFLMIATGDARSPLAHPVATWIGRRSYSMYLWHWPPVAIAHYLQYRRGPLESVLWVGIVVLLADLTWRFVERPFIAADWRPLRTLATCFVVPLACLIGYYALVRRLDGMPDRLGPEARHAHANLARFEPRGVDRCHDKQDDDLETCVFGDAGATTQALLIGDSHARHFRPFVDVLGKASHVKFYALSNSVCPTLEGAADKGSQEGRRGCIAATVRDFALIRSGRFRYVAFAERWVGYPPEALASLDHSLSVVVAAGATPILFAPVAEDGSDTRDCFYHHVKVRGPFVEDCTIRQDNDFARGRKQEVAALFDAMKRKYPTLIVIDPQAVQCRDGSCATVIDDTPIYVDTHHLAPFGATMLARDYLARFGDPLRR